MKILFMGTPDFAVPCLRELINNNYEISKVITQPDRPKGRGQKLMPSPVKEEAKKHNIEVLQPERIKDLQFVKQIKDMNPDIIVVVAFGQILPKAILDIPKYGCINVHASLLPKYRGAAPINWSIINGEKATGITTMYMDEGLDTGDMILKREIRILDSENAQQLHDKLSILGATLLVETIDQLLKGKASRTPQDHSQSTYAPMLSKTLGKINWNMSSLEIINLIRGVTPWPGAYTSYLNKTVKIFSVEALDYENENEKAGTIYKVAHDHFLVRCGKGSLSIGEIQFQNEKRMSVEAYLRGHNIVEGEILL